MFLEKSDLAKATGRCAAAVSRDLMLGLIQPDATTVRGVHLFTEMTVRKYVTLIARRRAERLAQAECRGVKAR